MLSGRRRHRGSAVSAGVSSSLLLQKTGEKPIEGPTKRPSTGSIEERAAPAALAARAGARRVGGRHTEYSEKVGKRGSMPKLIAQRPAIGSWTWSRDCVYWCRLAGPKGLADGHPPTTYCYVVCRWLGSSKAEENDGHRRHRPAAAAANAAPCGASAS